MIIDDFKDIHSRMLGDLKQQPKPEKEVCNKCGGNGVIYAMFCHIPCPVCSPVETPVP